MSAEIEKALHSKLKRGVVTLLCMLGAATTLIAAYVIALVAIGYAAHGAWGWGGALLAVCATLCSTSVAFVISLHAHDARPADVAEKSKELPGDESNGSTLGVQEAQNSDRSLKSILDGVRASGIVPAAAALLAVAVVVGPLRLFRLGLRAWSLFKAAEALTSVRHDT